MHHKCKLGLHTIFIGNFWKSLTLWVWSWNRQSCVRKIRQMDRLCNRSQCPDGMHPPGGQSKPADEVCAPGRILLDLRRVRIRDCRLLWMGQLLPQFVEVLTKNMYYVYFLIENNNVFPWWLLFFINVTRCSIHVYLQSKKYYLWKKKDSLPAFTCLISLVFAHYKSLHSLDITHT